MEDQTVLVPMEEKSQEINIATLVIGGLLLLGGGFLVGRKLKGRKKDDETINRIRSRFMKAKKVEGEEVEED